MKTTTHTTSLARPLMFLAFAVVAAALGLAASQTAAADGRIAFKLDPRLTQGDYLGDRWVSPATFTQVQSGERLIVSARSGTAANWVAADPGMVTVAPDFGSEVAITINHAGQTSLSAGGAVLAIKAVTVNDAGALKVDITQ